MGAANAALLAAAFSGPRQFARGNLTISIESVTAGGNVVTVRGEVRRAGAVVPVSWPLHVVNPPYSDVERLVDDVGALA